MHCRTLTLERGRLFLRSQSIARRLIPLADRVLVKRAAAKTVTSGGVFLPELNTPKMNEAEARTRCVSRSKTMERENKRA